MLKSDILMIDLHMCSALMSLLNSEMMVKSQCNLIILHRMIILNDDLIPERSQCLVEGRGEFSADVQALQKCH